MLQVLLLFKVLFTSGSQVYDLLCGVASLSEQRMGFVSVSLASGLGLLKLILSMTLLGWLIKLMACSNGKAVACTF